jgi:hypothetical protein
VLARIRLQIVNAVEDELTYDTDVTPKLTDFLPGYTFSSEVVLGGRAACYFDFYGGHVSSETVPSGATQTVVTVTTKGRPELLVTPLAAADRPGSAQRLCLGDEGASDVSMTVRNLELANERKAPDQQGGAFDFLLHYLTARGGIPQSIGRRTPGMQPELTSATSEDLAATLRDLAAVLEPGAPNHTRRTLRPVGEVTPSCSDSQYP